MQDTLSRLIAEKKQTTTMVVHRLATVADLDAIAVVHGGAIVEFGTHADLFQRRGLYYELVRAGGGGSGH